MCALLHSPFIYFILSLFAAHLCLQLNCHGGWGLCDLVPERESLLFIRTADNSQNSTTVYSAYLRSELMYAEALTYCRWAVWPTPQGYGMAEIRSMAVLVYYFGDPFL